MNTPVLGQNFIAEQFREKKQGCMWQIYLTDMIDSIIAMQHEPDFQ